MRSARAILKVINKDQDNWEDNLDSIMFCYRLSKHDSTKFIPFFLMYGREPKFPIELAVEGSPGFDDQDSCASLIRYQGRTAPKIEEKRCTTWR